MRVDPDHFQLMFFGESYDFVELLVPNTETAGRTADVRLGRAAGAGEGGGIARGGESAGTVPAMKMRTRGVRLRQIRTVSAGGRSAEVARDLRARVFLGGKPRENEKTALVRKDPPRRAEARSRRARECDGMDGDNARPATTRDERLEPHLRFLSIASSRLSLRIWIIPSSRLRRASSASMAFLKPFLRASVRDEGRSMAAR